MKRLLIILSVLLMTFMFIGCTNKKNTDTIELPSDFVTILESSFEVDVTGWGMIKLVCGYTGEGFTNDLKFYYKKNDKLIYEFPSIIENSGLVEEVKSVTFHDINDDNKDDVMIECTYYMGAGPQGMEPREMSIVFIATEDGYERQGTEQVFKNGDNGDDPR